VWNQTAETGGPLVSDAVKLAIDVQAVLAAQGEKAQQVRRQGPPATAGNPARTHPAAN